MSYGKPCVELKCGMNFQGKCCNSTLGNETGVIPCFGEHN